MLVNWERKMQIKLNDLNRVVLDVLKTYGYDESESNTIKNILLFAQLRGNNQGIVKLVGKGIPRRTDEGSIKVEKETSSSALINGKKNHAMVVMDHATEVAITKAKESGIGLVGNFNSSESTGALGYYVEKFANNGLIGFACSAAPFQSTAPYGSIDRLLCTNPISFGIPTTDNPIILDFATSEMAYFGLIEAHIAKQEVPLGVGYDSEGRETTDPEAIMNGAIKALAGSKGSGLALIVQILAGPLIGASFFETGNDNAGNLVLGINPEIFFGLEYLREKVEEMTKKIKTSRKAPGFSEILLPGERGYNQKSANIAAGYIEIEDALWSQLQAKLS